ncbi:hypothetical protein GX411_08060 [Candidatus Fermentibacteria bacterium]|nr:hypothetical protein [Candidatus Fermentibacteria bacterium]
MTAFSFAAGVALLSAEVTWSRTLLVLVGGSVDASASVLSSVMLGLALGSVVFGRMAGRAARPAVLLRVLAAASGAASLLPVVLAGPLSGLYPVLMAGPAPQWLVRALLSAALLIPPSALAGGLIPALAAVVAASGGGREISRLYAWNSAGASLGGLAAGLVLLEALGARLTLASSALLMAASSLFVRGRETVMPSGAAAGGPPGAVLCILYAAGGAIALAWEAVWARQLTFLLGNSTYAFALMGGAVLAGMSAGGFAGRRLACRAAPLGMFAAAESFLSISALLPLAAVLLLPGLPPALGLGGAAAAAAHHLLALLSIVPAAVCMGATFPLMVAAGARPESLGPDVGVLSMANALGAGLGPFLATRLVFPLAGVTDGAALLAALGGAVALAAAAVSGRRSAAAPAILLPASAVLLALSADPPGSAPPPGGLDLRFFMEDRTATVTVFGREWDGYRSLRINGVEEVPIDQPSLEAFNLLGHLPWAYNRDARDVLVVALGGGITAGAVLTHPVDTLVCAEICPAVVLALPIFEGENGRPELDPRFTLVEDDGRNFVAGSGRRWDIVICDATHPGSSDSWVLYTREFYEDLLEHLSDGGVAAQWLPLHQLPAEDLERILATWAAVFPHRAIHLAGGRHAVLVGSPEPLELDAARMFDTPEARRMLAMCAFTPADTSYLEPLATDWGGGGGGSARAGLNTDDRAPCQFMRRRIPADPQATIAPGAATLLAMSGGSDALRRSQMIYWSGDPAGAVEEIRGAPETPLSRRWLSLYLCTGAEQAMMAGMTEDAAVLAGRARSADGSWDRPARLLGALGRE